MDAQSKQKFFFDNTFPPMYLFRYIKQEADKLLGIDDAMAQSEAPYELADNMDSKRLSYIKFINNGNSKEIVTDLPNVFVYQLLGSVIFFLASVYCIFTVYSEGLCQLAVMIAGMSALIFYMNAVSKCRYLIRFSDFEIFISKKNLFGKQDVVLKGGMDDFINIIPCEFQSKRDKVHQSFFYIKIIMKKNKEDIPQAVNLSEQSEASLLFSVLFNADNLSRLFPKNIDSPYDVINLFEENRFNSEQAEFLVRKMKEFFGVKS
ncbi:MAG: hypothetical protein MJ234_03455 [bacterium]|nr:hypothetical protein [bacterium]